LAFCATSARPEVALCARDEACLDAEAVRLDAADVRCFADAVAPRPFDDDLAAERDLGLPLAFVLRRAVAPLRDEPPDFAFDPLEALAERLLVPDLFV
jgi:hypothetical protein